MDLELIREYCLSKPSVSESTPFNETTLVFKVLNKIFCLLNSNPPFSINLKCLPEKAIELREEYEEIRPGFHMNKKHWNTIELEGNLSWKLFKEMIDDSYRLVVEKMPKKDREKL
ncbi:MAG: MmcQ/YjbR family DNA-binding protein [Melioribacteraceae bacterium]